MIIFTYDSNNHYTLTHNNTLNADSLNDQTTLANESNSQSMQIYTLFLSDLLIGQSPLQRIKEPLQLFRRQHFNILRRIKLPPPSFTKVHALYIQRRLLYILP